MFDGKVFMAESVGSEAYRMVFATQQPLRVYFQPLVVVDRVLPDELSDMSFRERQIALLDVGKCCFEWSPGAFRVDRFLPFENLDQIWVFEHVKWIGEIRIISAHDPKPLLYITQRYVRCIAIIQNVTRLDIPPSGISSPTSWFQGGLRASSVSVWWSVAQTFCVAAHCTFNRLNTRATPKDKPVKEKAKESAAEASAEVKAWAQRFMERAPAAKRGLVAAADAGSSSSDGEEDVVAAELDDEIVTKAFASFVDRERLDRMCGPVVAADFRCKLRWQHKNIVDKGDLYDVARAKPTTKAMEAWCGLHFCPRQRATL